MKLRKLVVENIKGEKVVIDPTYLIDFEYRNETIVLFYSDEVSDRVVTYCRDDFIYPQWRSIIDFLEERFEK